MKIKLLFFAMISVFLIGCSSNDEVQEVKDGKVVIDLSSVESIQLRSIYSQEPTNRATIVTLYAFKENNGDYTLEKTYKVSDWTKGTTFKRYEIPVGDQPSPGNYIFMAVAEEEKSEYKFENITVLDQFYASLEKKIGTTEFFAGTSAAVQVLASGARISLEMKRKVAGIMGYFSNVPNEMQGKKVGHLRVVATRVNLIEYVYSSAGAKAAGETVILDIDLKKQGIDKSLSVFAGNDISTVKVSKLVNTQLGGAYLLPIDKVELFLRLYADDGKTVLKEWPVLYKGEQSIELKVNHLYTIGVKPTVDSTKGDEPIDLMKSFVVALTLNPDWTSIENLTIKE